jgi:hypothetical protein
MLGEVCPAKTHTPLRETNSFPQDTLMLAWKIDGYRSHLHLLQQLVMINAVILTKVRLAEEARRIFSTRIRRCLRLTGERVRRGR